MALIIGTGIAAVVAAIAAGIAAAVAAIAIGAGEAVAAAVGAVPVDGTADGIR